MVCDLVVIVFIVMCVVTGKVYVFKGREVGLFKVVVIVIYSVYLIWL